jgi:hypothetical protein
VVTPGTLVTQKNDPSKGLKKTRESFGPPSAPDAVDFAWGPSIDLRGVELNGHRIDFDRTSPNGFTIEVASGDGSCPYLYAFDDGAGEWVRHGKIIHDASGPQKEMTQRVEFPGLVNRFSIREEELEVSYIRSVRLEAQLRELSVGEFSRATAPEQLSPRSANAKRSNSQPVIASSQELLATTEGASRALLWARAPSTLLGSAATAEIEALRAGRGRRPRLQIELRPDFYSSYKGASQRSLALKSGRGDHAAADAAGSDRWPRRAPR